MYGNLPLFESWKRCQKAGSLGPISSKITLTEEKERKKRKRREEEKRRREKNNGCTLSFYNGRFGGNVFKNPATYYIYAFFCQVLMVSSHKPEDWITNCTNALKKASTLFSSSGSVNAFSLFESAPYCAKRMGDDGSEDDKLQDMDRIKNNDLIFKDHSGCLETIPKVS